MNKILLYVAAAQILSVIFMPAVAAPINISNYSFEDSNPLLNNDPRGDWNSTIIGWNYNGSTGTYQPSTPGNPQGQDVYIQDVPDGLNVAWSHYGNIWQVLDATLEANMIYTLSADIGNRLDFPLPGNSLQLRAGGSILASAISSAASGQFDNLSVSYTSLPNSLIGSNIEVWLVNDITAGYDYQINWDNIQLDVSAVPVPAAAWLFGSGIICLIGVSRRKKI